MSGPLLGALIGFCCAVGGRLLADVFLPSAEPSDWRSVGLAVIFTLVLLICACAITIGVLR